MKTIRSFTKNPLTIAVLLIAFLNLSCNQDDFVESYVDNSVSDKYSGEEIFKGVFFFQGDIPKNIDAFNDILINLNNRKDAKAINDELNSLANEVAHYIQNKDANYFETLKKTIESGDYFSVQDYLNYTGGLIEQAIILSEKYGSEYLGYKKLLENEAFENELKKIDFSKPESAHQYKSLLKDFGVTPPDPTNVDECAPVAGFCVAYAVAVAASVAVAAASAAGYFQVVVKTKYWFWDSTEVGFGKTKSDDLINQQIISQLCNLLK